ncbi:MAG: AbrB/MazE/SpoVT family DNA-binding domain-containing protein [Clostridiaceae bacterium]|jgi:transcriptional pleiotropic regulator of transition state genes|nr:AbrB/MazE/SpoVT family DNA-binding domain-containing protein [Clostridiaceae bacterium]
MKATGMIRSLDQLGRIVIPIELRRVLDIAIGDGLEFYSDESTIVLKKYEPACIFCDNAKDITVYRGKNVCGECYSELKKSL